MKAVRRLALAARVAKGVNPYLNTSPTELARMLLTAKGKRKKLIQEALNAWRSTTQFGAVDTSPGSQTPDPAGGGGGGEPTGGGGKQAARPIPLDKQLIERELNRMVRNTRQMLRGLPPGEPIGRQNIYMSTVTTTNPRGDEVSVIIALMAQPGGGTELTLDAGFSRLPIGDAVVLTLNGGLPPEEFERRGKELRQVLWRTLIHEMTHVLDLTRGAESGNVAPKTMDEWVRYFNLPREVRAYMQEIVDQVLQAVPRGYSGRVDQALINRALMRSRTWQEIGSLFSADSRKRILKAVYMAVQERIESVPYSKAAALLTASLIFEDAGKSPLTYQRASNIKRLTVCDPNVTDPPSKHDTYFAEIERWRRRTRSGRPLKRPVLEEVIPGVGDNACIVGFLDWHEWGPDAVYIDYVKTRNDQRGKGYARALIEEFYRRFAGKVNLIHWGKLMQPAMGHLLEKMKAAYPSIESIGARYY